MAGCKTHFQCPCCKEVFEIDASATTNVRSFVDKNGDIIQTRRLVSVVLDNPKRIPPFMENEEVAQDIEEAKARAKKLDKKSKKN